MTYQSLQGEVMFIHNILNLIRKLKVENTPNEILTCYKPLSNIRLCNLQCNPSLQ